jgi:hypothetical protein
LLPQPVMPSISAHAASTVAMVKFSGRMREF